MALVQKLRGQANIHSRRLLILFHMLGHPLCTNFAIIKLFVDYVMHSSFAYQQFNSNFTCGDPTILPYELIHSRNRGTFVTAYASQGVASP
ncbi:hypothetical protein AVEN_261396-1 [Araneus ventricosus]|uniref:Uncharacterized protein n=1 Tax=Araneus ventricosus TaxID=182803 RepID=A0A4Y2FFS0_ARAVE|nr:hypothetical protein AVEN_251602-1 [Araneus ventricosus]GBM39509.1 hypothetical protein AVEN_92047-1 [Araneus ventricosus]GBM61220.1 hypothetical protein AVEN_261396-1 [Araneus ventricosus]